MVNLRSGWLSQVGLGPPFLCQLLPDLSFLMPLPPVCLLHDAEVSQHGQMVTWPLTPPGPSLTTVLRDAECSPEGLELGRIRFCIQVASPFFSFSSLSSLQLPSLLDPQVLALIFDLSQQTYLLLHFLLVNSAFLWSLNSHSFFLFLFLHPKRLLLISHYYCPHPSSASYTRMSPLHQKDI